VLSLFSFWNSLTTWEPLPIFRSSSIYLCSFGLGSQLGFSSFIKRSRQNDLPESLPTKANVDVSTAPISGDLQAFTSSTGAVILSDSSRGVSTLVALPSLFGTMIRIFYLDSSLHRIKIPLSPVKQLLSLRALSQFQQGHRHRLYSLRERLD
jgi:hypothetical protein